MNLRIENEFENKFENEFKNRFKDLATTHTCLIDWLFLEKETGMQHSGIAQPSKHAYNWTNGLASTWLPFIKSLCFQSPNRSLQPGNEPSLIQKKEQSQ